MFRRKKSAPAHEPRELPKGARRLHMVFRGEVQAVGFRWNAQIKAREVGLTGWVRNEWDGSVTMELQGTDQEISEFFGRFSRAYAYHPINYVIDSKDEIPLDPTEGDFIVRFDS